MGCDITRPANTFEEDAIFEAEKSLQLSSISSERIDIHFHRFSVDLNLTINQFRAAYEELQIDLRVSLNS